MAPRASSPAEAPSFPSVSSALQMLVRPPVPASTGGHDPGGASRLREGRRACDLRSRLGLLLGQADAMSGRSRVGPETHCARLHQLLARLARLQETDRLLDAIECSSACMAQISDPACLRCLLRAHSALSISPPPAGRGVSLERQRQCMASSICEHFSAGIRGALDRILASRLRACHETRAQAHLTKPEASDQLASLLSGLRVEDAAPISAHWSDQLFYTALCREAAVVCESLSSLALSVSEQVRRRMHLGDSGPLTALLHAARSFVSACEHAFSVSFPTGLMSESGEAGLLLGGIEETGPYFSARLKLARARGRPRLIGRLFGRSAASPIEAYVERIRQNFSGPAAWAPPYPEPGQSLVSDSSAARRWHTTGAGQLFVDFLVLFLGSIFDAFTLGDQIATFPSIGLYLSNNPVAEEGGLFARVFATYSGMVASEAGGLRAIE